MYEEKVNEQVGVSWKILFTEYMRAAAMIEPCEVHQGHQLVHQLTDFTKFILGQHSYCMPKGQNIE